MVKKIRKTAIKKTIDSDLSYMKEDKTLKKIERYVDKNREKTSQRISEMKKKRPATKFQKADLEVMISRISNESKSKEKTKEISKRVLFIIYAIIVVVIFIFIIKYFFVGNMSQIS